ncbi:50S ribosomal protein L4 [Chloracidobacterium validum]|uniref:Large ribosomal subunit protein uL4 n=1 Tax=Chloracidobacterium validum TaxID=2821543 RepID=A0ABX8B960_9BACT|nr:50S ribosomal protein L4 [Chloracidobacterium validum]QUW03472.1 50S ribosomal protein L4 [Chloracidobacterium validum]
MTTVKMRTLDNDQVSDLEISSVLWQFPLNTTLISEAIHEYRARGRAGTVATKTRGDVSGSGKKLWKQKGTGRARISSIRSPLWKGGGNVHGPQPRDWSYNLPKKKRWKAIATIFAERLRENNVLVVSDLSLFSHKTKLLKSKIDTLGLLGHKILIIDSTENKNLILASRNLPGVKAITSLGVNVYDLLFHEKVLISKSALNTLSDSLSRILNGK